MVRFLHPQIILYLQVGVGALILAVIFTPILIRLLNRFGAIDHVSHDKFHKRPVPRGGGIAIFLAFALAVLLPNYRDNPMKGVMLGAFICLVVGVVDDFRPGGVPAILKFLTLIVVTWIMSLFGVQLKVFGWYPLDLALTVVWIVGVTSAFNGIDNMDGLASGTATIVSVMFLIIAVEGFLAVGTEHSLTWFGLLACGLIGANLGFLIFNFHNARVFMGDAGSFFLGFTLSALGVMGEWNSNRIIACLIPVLILGVPIFDFAYILVARIVRGETRTLRQIVEHCALDHLSHRLTWIGFSPRNAVLFIYLISIGLGITGVLLRNSRSFFDTFLGLLQGLTVVSIVVILMASSERRQRRAVVDAPFERRAAGESEDDATDAAPDLPVPDQAAELPAYKVGNE